MKKTMFLFCAALAVTTALASAQEWMTNYDDALKKAKSENKPILIDFTGSDWCGWCMKLDKEVFSLAEFQDYAAKKLVLLKADFPRHKELPAAEKAQNEKLASQFHIEGYPTIVVLDSNGKKEGELGYMPGGPKAFIAELEKSARK